MCAITQEQIDKGFVWDIRPCCHVRCEIVTVLYLYCTFHLWCDTDRTCHFSQFLLCVTFSESHVPDQLFVAARRTHGKACCTAQMTRKQTSCFVGSFPPFPPNIFTKIHRSPALYWKSCHLSSVIVWLRLSKRHIQVFLSLKIERLVFRGQGHKYCWL